MPVFWKWNNTQGWEAFEVLDCLFALPNAAADLLQKFNSNSTFGPNWWSGWMCPDSLNFDQLIYNSTLTSWSDGVSAYQYTVEYCDVAARYFLIKPSDFGCLTDIKNQTSIDLANQLMEDAGASVSTMAVT
jgi:hypothetical protein